MAVADRQALLTAAAVNGALEGYQPLSVAERMEAWEVAMATDPADTAEAREAETDRQLLEEVA